MTNIFETFNISWNSFMLYLPALLGGIICIIITLLLANVFAKIVKRYSLRRAKDPLIANFIGKTIYTIIFILGIVLALGILGLGTVSNKILAGAGLTTFIIGFALKDIGENFLSGIILAFGRPYRIGNLIECVNVKGIVRDMTMRQTTVEAENGKIILIPNSFFIKNPLIKHINDDNNLQQEFSINIDADRAKEGMQKICDTINSFDSVMRNQGKSAKVIIEQFTGDKVKLLVIYWFDIEKFNGSRSNTKSEIMLAVFENLNVSGFKISG